ncbi:DUF4339 domain-containing protein [Aporhodopirellula aestuarii]|uniref:DUF4339 domain-containing protein n=1 Tax=Aporhodopirellula aestuarii TaxID=2950107 RepID=A0ABT0U9D0_9BACT|nr:GYF domain-containing protein [Aporhodopirellula aestuarii]MCM2373530.1 DUF4339 domain-containing protein [Aporhodopirellula aestuarii]
MGVRFACHACGKRLNIKSELAGRRGICPSCSARFRIPTHDTETSTPIHSGETYEGDESSGSVSSAGGQTREAHHGSAVATAPSTAKGTAYAQSPGAPVVATQSAASHASSVSQSVADATPLHASPAHSVAPQTQHGPQPSMDEILGDAASTWYVRPPSGGQYGPANGPTLGQWIQEGRVADTAMLWRDGWPDWRMAKEVLPVFAPQPTPQSNGSVSPPGVATAPAVMPSPAVNPAAASGPAPSRVEIREGGKVLGTNKKKVSRKRVAISVMLACVFVVLLVALILVLKQP